MLVAASLATPALRAQPRPELSRLTIAVGGKASFYHLPLTIAEQLGYFKAEGLDVLIRDFPGGAPAIQAVLNGSAHVVSGAFEHIIKLQSRGQLFQAFVLQGRAPQIALGVSTHTMPGFKSVHDLKGKRIGITTPGSSTQMLANLVLSRYGLKASDVDFVGVGASSAALAAMRSGQLDALSNIDPLMTMLEQRGDVRIVYDTRTLKGTQEVFGGPMPAACLFAPVDFLQKHPGTVQALSYAIVHALKWLQTAGPSDIIKTVPESYLLGDRGLYLAAFSKVREALAVDGVFPDEGGKTALRALNGVDSALRAEKIDLEKTYTNEYALRAKGRFKA